MVHAAAPDSSETQLPRAAALESALRQIVPVLANPNVVEILLDTDGHIWVDRLGEGMGATDARIDPPQRSACCASVEVNTAGPSLATELRRPPSASKPRFPPGRAPAQQTRATVRHTLHAHRRDSLPLAGGRDRERARA